MSLVVREGAFRVMGGGRRRRKYSKDVTVVNFLFSYDAYRGINRSRNYAFWAMKVTAVDRARPIREADTYNLDGMRCVEFVRCCPL